MQQLSSAFPRAATYDQDWTFAESMGPNVVWFTDAATQPMDLRPGMRVLDIGCGRGASSIFIAEQFRVDVWAFDLWVSPHENQARMWERGLTHPPSPTVFCLHGEAHALPFQSQFFDAVCSVDSYHYWGTEPGYLDYLAQFVKPGGQIGICVPGLNRDLDEMPDFLSAEDRLYWLGDDVRTSSFQSPAWWRRLWEQTPAVRVEVAENVPDGTHWWQESNLHRADPDKPSQDARILEIDAGRTFDMVRLVATVA